MEPQRLLDGGLRSRHLAQRLVGRRAAIGVQLVQFFDHRCHRLGVAEQLDERPRQRRRRGVMPGEHHRDEHARHVVGTEHQRAVLVAERQQHVDEVAIVALRCRLGETLLQDRVDEFDEFGAGGVAAVERRDVEVGVDEGERVGALLEVVEQLGELRRQVLTELGADETRRGRVDGQLGEPIEHLELATVAEPLDHPVDLGGDLLGVAAHELVAQRLVVHHLAPTLGRCVEDHTLPEDGLHEGVRLGLVELVLGRTEVGLVGLGARQQRDGAIGEEETPDVAALGTDAFHEPDGVGAELLEMAAVLADAGHQWRDGQGGGGISDGHADSPDS